MTPNLTFLTALLLAPLAALHATDAPSASLARDSGPALVLAGDSPAAFNDIDNPNRVTPQKTTLTFIKGAANLPPHSLTIVKVPLR